MPESADFVMFWWHKAALETLAGRTRRFGFITTNSIRQTFNRRVVKAALDDGLYLTFAIPDHPWIDATECAAVRIAMTVGALAPTIGAALRRDQPASESRDKPAPTTGQLHRVTHEVANEDTGENEVQLDLNLGKVSADLTAGADVASTVELKANACLAYRGVQLIGSGFIVTTDEAETLGLAKNKGLERHLRPYRNGRDLTDAPRGVMVIDLFGLTAEEARGRFPKVYEHVLATVKPERDQNNRAGYRDNWWIHGEPRRDLRKSLDSLPRYIATVETAKHRVFQFLEAEILPDNMLVVSALADAFHLGVLSSRIHVVYALAAGGTLEDRPRYNKSRCFDPFPFPDCTEKQKEKIRALAEELDAHRKRAQATHQLGLTDIYNVLEKLRAAAPGAPTSPSASAAPLTPKDRAIHDAALVSTLKQLHDELDAAVAGAYGWPWPLTDAEILERVVALNTARAAEEAKGTIRWLRPDYQIPLFSGTKQSALDLADDSAAPGKPSRSDGKRLSKPLPPGSNRRAPAKKIPWPKTLSDRVRAVETALAAEEKPATAADLAKRFTRAKPEDLAEILDTLVTLARARPGDTPGTFVR